MAQEKKTTVQRTVATPSEDGLAELRAKVGVPRVAGGRRGARGRHAGAVSS